MTYKQVQPLSTGQSGDIMDFMHRSCRCILCGSPLKNIPSAFMKRWEAFYCSEECYESDLLLRDLEEEDTVELEVTLSLNANVYNTAVEEEKESARLGLYGDKFDDIDDNTV